MLKTNMKGSKSYSVLEFSSLPSFTLDTWLFYIMKKSNLNCQTQMHFSQQLNSSFKHHVVFTSCLCFYLDKNILFMHICEMVQLYSHLYIQNIMQWTESYCTRKERGQSGRACGNYSGMADENCVPLTCYKFGQSTYQVCSLI